MKIWRKLYAMMFPSRHKEELEQEVIALYEQMSQLTKPECKNTCKVPLSCCSPEYCEMAEDIALEYWDVDIRPMRTKHPTLPYMAAGGCVVPPHLRPACTMHTCAMNGLGFKAGDMGWTERYNKLRARINAAENELYSTYLK